MALVSPLSAIDHALFRRIRYVFTVLSMVAALFTILVIISCKDRPSTKYSRLILAIVATSLISEVHLQFVYDPIFLLPVPCFARDSPLLDIPGRAAVHHCIWSSLAVLNAPVFLACFIHRHQAVMSLGSRWSFSPRVQNGPPLLFALLVIVFPLIHHNSMQLSGAVHNYTGVIHLAVKLRALIHMLFLTDALSGMAVFYRGHCSVFSKMLSHDWPSSLLERADCFLAGGLLLFSIIATIALFVGSTLIFVISYHTFATLRDKSTISERMKEYHRTMTKVLILQSGIPALFALFPLSVCFAVFFFDWNGILIIPICFISFSAYTFLHSVAVLTTTPVYRRQLAAMFREAELPTAHIEATSITPRLHPMRKFRKRSSSHAC